MLVIPTIYLRQGQATNPTPDLPNVLPSDPLRLGETFRQAGAEMVHIVDLDAGVVAGHSPNESVIEQLHTRFGFHCQVAGPIRALEAAQRYCAIGVGRLVLGTLAFQQPALLQELTTHCPGRIAVEIAVRGGRVVIKGWTVATHKSAAEYAAQFRAAGVTNLLYTDTTDDGSITIENLRRIREFAIAAQVPVLHASDLERAEQLDQLILLEKFGVMGTILSKSLYAGRLSLPALITRAKDHEAAANLDDSTAIQD